LIVSLEYLTGIVILGVNWNVGALNVSALVGVETVAFLRSVVVYRGIPTLVRSLCTLQVALDEKQLYIQGCTV